MLIGNIISVLTTTVYITAGAGLDGAFFFLFRRHKISTTTIIKTMSSTPPMTPPTIAPVDDFLSLLCSGLLVFPGEKGTNYFSSIEWFLVECQK